MTTLRETELTNREATWDAGLLLFAFAIYSNTLFNGFVFDDHFQIERNPYLQSINFIGKILTTPVWSFVGTEGAPNFYRPMMMLVYFICHALFGDSPAGYHLMEVLLHVAVVWLVFTTTRRLFDDAKIGYVASAIFAVHPIHTETVAWIAGITDIELSLFFLLSFQAFLKLDAAEKGRAFRLQAGMLASFAAALLSKEVAVTLPVLATVFEHFYRADRRQTTWRCKVQRYAGFWILTATYLTVRFAVFGGILSKSFHADLSIWQSILSGVSLVGHYFQRFFWPWPLVFYNPFQKSASILDASVLFGLLVLLASAALFLFFWRNNRLLSFAILWVFITLGLVLNARWMPGTVFAERYWYLPSIGLSWLLGVGFVKLVRWRSPERTVFRGVALATSILMALSCAAAVIARNRDWKSDYTLSLQTLKLRPHAAHFLVNLGEVSWQQGNHEEAKQEWRRAIAEDPREPYALWSFGRALLDEKQYAESRIYLDEAIRVAPQYAAPHIYRGRLFLDLGKDAEAEAEFIRAVQLNPFQTESRNTLGEFYFDRGRFAEAETQFRASLKSFPSEKAYEGVAESAAKLGKTEEAEANWKQVLLLEPFEGSAHRGLGRIYLLRGQWVDATREYEAILLMNPKDQEALAAIEKIKPLGGANSHR
jgi:tetratricopeptide (TPR) repeat protein